MNKLDKILKCELCIGCGLCESLGKDAGYRMELSNNGFYYPKLPQNRKIEIENKIINICPSINISAPKTNSIEWGIVKNCYVGWSNDEIIRKRAASGGIITSIAIYLLEKKLIDGVISIKANETDYKKNELYISRTKDDILNCAGSRYAPTLFFNDLIQILKKNNDKYLLIGKPCDILAVKNLIKEYSEYRNKFYFYISIFCGGMPSLLGTEKLIQQSNHKSQINKINYRGDGWPGYFTINFQDSFSYKVSYNDSWGKVLGKFINFRCKLCPDGIGLNSDITIGDAWKTKDGYPDFAETKGRCFILVRNTKANNILTEAYKNGNITLEEISEKEIQIMQPHQYKRRFFSPYKIYLYKGLHWSLLKTNNLCLLKLFLKSNKIKGFKYMIGFLLRIKKKNNYKI